MLRPAEELVAPAVAETIRALGLESVDAAAVKLAEQYAEVIDAAANDKERAWVMRWIAPQLLECLESLNATPAARARLKGGRTPDAPKSRIQALRDSRTA